MNLWDWLANTQVLGLLCDPQASGWGPLDFLLLRFCSCCHGRWAWGLLPGEGAELSYSCSQALSPAWDVSGPWERVLLFALQPPLWPQLVFHPSPPHSKDALFSLPIQSMLVLQDLPGVSPTPGSLPWISEPSLCFPFSQLQRLSIIWITENHRP